MTDTIDRNGIRYYVHPDTGLLYPSVTSCLKTLPKPWLAAWAAKTIAVAAVEEYDVWSLAPTDQDKIDWLKKVQYRKNPATVVGTAVHLAIQTGDWSPVNPGFRAAYDAFVAEHDVLIEARERTVFNEEVGYAGTLDALGWVDGRAVVLDWKTGRHYPENWLQLEAYARIAMCERALVHLRWDSTYELEIRPQSDDDFAAFCAAVDLTKWSVEHGQA